jgi:serine/threonine protein kinase
MDPQESLGGGRYVVRGLLGEGAQGKTYEATDTRSGRTVAIKRFDVRGARSWKDVELAERETRVLASLDHPLVPRYIEHFEEGGALFLVMEKVEGETLEAIRKREGALPEVEVRRFLACADRALTYLHGRGSPVVHRDVKPSNVVRRPDGSYVFVDFGAVSEFLFRRGSSTIVGTMGYMAPEQLQGRALATSDVYAVGATALAALTGAEPETLPHKDFASTSAPRCKGEPARSSSRHSNECSNPIPTCAPRASAGRSTSLLAPSRPSHGLPRRPRRSLASSAAARTRPSRASVACYGRCGGWAGSSCRWSSASCSAWRWPSPS